MRRLFMSTAVSLLAVTGSPGKAPEAPKVSQGSAALHPAAQRGKELIAALNKGGKDALRAYIETSFAPAAAKAALADPQLVSFGFRRYMMGEARFVRFAARSPTEGDVVFFSELLGRHQQISVQVEPTAPHRLTSVGLPEETRGEIKMPQHDGERVAMVRALAQRLSERDVFSGVVLLARNGKPILHQAYGLAERRFQVPNHLDTRFTTASITKPITAVAIAQLAERGMLSFDDPLSKFLPDFPTTEAANKIRIKHLLSNTSGLGDTIGSQRAEAMTNFRSIADFMAAAPRTAPAFEPGTGYLYSNLGFLLLGRVIEIASGQDYYEYVSEHIFQAAGMRSAGNESPDSVVTQLAYNYDPGKYLDQGKYFDTAIISRARSAPYGGAYMTAMDLLVFDRAVRSGVLIKPGTWALMNSPKPELGATAYGYGIDREEFGNMSGRRAVGHGGNATGACGVWATIEDAGDPLTVIILSNSGFFACWLINNYVFEVTPPLPPVGR